MAELIDLAVLKVSRSFPGMEVKVKERPRSSFPAWNVFVRVPGAVRGRHVFTVVDFEYISDLSK